MVAHLDYLRFHHWYVNSAVQWYADTYRKLGVDIPMYLNYYTGLDVQNWRDMAQTVDFTGIDTYPAREFSKSKEAYPDCTDS